MQDATGKVISWRVARVSGFGFDSLWYSRLLHMVCTRSCCPSGLWDTHVLLLALPPPLAVSAGAADSLIYFFL